VGSESTTRWPLLQERAPYGAASSSSSSTRRKHPRSAWILVGLAFLCGGLVSAAAFSIGWRHQAQRDTAAREALAAATARTQSLERQVSALQASLAAAHGKEANAEAAAAAFAASAARVGAAARASGRAGRSISSGAASVSGAAGRVASELKTLDSYLTTTPSGQLDPGYVTSQAAYLTQQLTRLQDDAGSIGGSVTSFEAALGRLDREAKPLVRR
jgi:hypothetical protein